MQCVVTNDKFTQDRWLIFNAQSTMTITDRKTVQTNTNFPQSSRLVDWHQHHSLSLIWLNIIWSHHSHKVSDSLQSHQNIYTILKTTHHHGNITWRQHTRPLQLPNFDRSSKPHVPSALTMSFQVELVAVAHLLVDDFQCLLKDLLSTCWLQCLRAGVPTRSKHVPVSRITTPFSLT